MSVNDRHTLEDLTSKVLDELRRLHYSARVQAEYRRCYRRLLAYARVRGIDEYSEELGHRFLEEIAGVRMGALPEPLPRRFPLMLRYLRCLGDYQLHGALTERKSRTTHYEPPEAFRTVLEAFARERDRRGLSPRSTRERATRLRAFVDYLAQGRRG